jgi:hypothetical protein
MISSIIYHLSNRCVRDLKEKKWIRCEIKKRICDALGPCSDVMHLREKKNPRQLFNLSFSYLQARAGDNQMRRFYWVV